MAKKKLAQAAERAIAMATTEKTWTCLAANVRRVRALRRQWSNGEGTR